METTIKNRVEYTYDKVKLAAKINETIENIEKWIAANNYRVAGDLPSKSIITNDENYNGDWRHMSKTKKKEINRYICWLERKMTLRGVNSFLRLLSKVFGIEKSYPKVKISLKEEQIQNARKQWLKAREESDRLLAAYKDEKGDFYKKTVTNLVKQ